MAGSGTEVTEFHYPHTETNLHIQLMLKEQRSATMVDTARALPNHWIQLQGPRVNNKRGPGPKHRDQSQGHNINHNVPS